MTPALQIQETAGSRRLGADELRRAADGEGRIRVSDLVEAGTEATHATFESADGTYRASIPLEVARAQGVVLLGEAGDLRLVVEDGETLCWNVKDLGRIRVTVGKEADSVPAQPPH